jgi:hypothetical protein
MPRNSRIWLSLSSGTEQPERGFRCGQTGTRSIWPRKHTGSSQKRSWMRVRRTPVKIRHRRLHHPPPALVTEKGFRRVWLRYRSFRLRSGAGPDPELSQQAGCTVKLNHATGRHGRTTSGDAPAGVTVPAGALGRGEAPVREERAGPGDGDQSRWWPITIDLERYPNKYMPYCMEGPLIIRSFFLVLFLIFYCSQTFFFTVKHFFLSFQLCYYNCSSVMNDPDPDLHGWMCLLPIHIREFICTFSVHIYPFIINNT